MLFILCIILTALCYKNFRQIVNGFLEIKIIVFL
jgi:hypothetical protein